MTKKCLRFVIAIFPFLAWAQPSQDYLDCLDRFTERLSGQLKAGDLQEIRDQCRALKLLPPDQRERFAEFDEYYIKCKAFRMRQIPRLGLKEVKSRYAACRELAGLYIRNVSAREKASCRLKSCFVEKQEEKCVGEGRTLAVSEVELCGRVFAPLQCMEESEIPGFVLWDDGGEKGKLDCWRF